ARGRADRGGAELGKRVPARDASRRREINDPEEVKASHNRAAKELARKYPGGAIPADVRHDMRVRADRIKELDAAIGTIDAEIERLLLQLPNLPDPSVPAGTTEDQNVEVRRRGTPRAFGFTPESDRELGEALGLLHFWRAAKI